MPSKAPHSSIKLPSIGMTRAKIIVNKEKTRRNTYSQISGDLETVVGMNRDIVTTV